MLFFTHPFVKSSFCKNIYTLDEWNIKPNFKVKLVPKICTWFKGILTLAYNSN